jgi:hypothetical protein
VVEGSVIQRSGIVREAETWGTMIRTVVIEGKHCVLAFIPISVIPILISRPNVFASAPPLYSSHLHNNLFQDHQKSAQGPLDSDLLHLNWSFGQVGLEFMAPSFSNNVLQPVCVAVSVQRLEW